MTDPAAAVPPVRPATGLVTLDADGLIAADLSCLGCGYLLRKQPPHGRCPECHTPVARTLHASNVRLADRQWLRQIQTAAVCLAVAIPTVPFFGFGLLFWLLGVMVLHLAVPNNKPRFRRLRNWSVLSPVAAGLVLVGVSGMFHRGIINDAGLTHSLRGLAGALGVHFGFMLFFGGAFAREAGWASVKWFGYALAWSAWLWSLCLGVAVAVSVGWFDPVSGGSGVLPAWLDTVFEPFRGIMWFGPPAHALAQFVFWVLLAVRMRRIIREADRLAEAGPALVSPPAGV